MLCYDSIPASPPLVKAENRLFLPLTSSARRSILSLSMLKGGGGMKKGKLAAPIAVTALLCIWFGGWGITVFRLLPGLPLPVKLDDLDNY